MTISAIQSNNDNRMLTTVSKASAIGAGLGYVSKYVLPINEQERDLNYKKITNIVRKESYNIKGEMIQEIRNIKNKSLAQDTFIKMIDNKKPLNIKTVKNEITKLGGPESIPAIEFKNIINNINESAIKMAKKFIATYEGYMKKCRPTAPFIAAGAITGLIVGVTHNVLSTNSKA